MEMMLSSILSIFDEALSLTNQTYAEFEARQLQEALNASLSLSGNPPPPPTSSSRISSCEICTDEKWESDMFDVDGCRHSFCAVCVSKHVEYKLRDGAIHVTCPAQGCSNVIQPGALRAHVAAEVLHRWEEAVAESAILASEGVRCPYGDCAEVLVNDGGGGGAAVVAECECPWCHRLFCARCKVTWQRVWSVRSLGEREGGRERRRS